ncbi:MAG: sigma-54 dependent transcriptional regulator, partial [Steroidobacteraceae bacterium]
SRMSLETRTAADVASARRLLKSQHFDLCLTDMRLPDGDGLDLGVLRKLVGSAIKLGARADDAAATIAGRVRLLGHSPVMQQLREMIGRVARSQAPVHIYGESGTGKELVARLIHESGARSEGPFVPVNCGAIPTELMESEFFGHKRGSFTGAVADKKGLVQSAEGGTLFLDEVADLPLHMQVKLLRLVQEKTVRPVGESREESVDVRILSATHKNLSDLVAEGRFREDLFYRINVIELRVASLRERPEDIPVLAGAILGRLCRRMKVDTARISEEALQALQSYPFPGNVRELENALERALTLSTGGVITPEHIKLRAVPRGAVPHLPTSAPVNGSVALGDQLEDIERDAIVKALEKTRYNKTAAAKLLGMTFRALRYRIKKLGIE